MLRQRKGAPRDIPAELLLREATSGFANAGGGIPSARDKRPTHSGRHLNEFQEVGTIGLIN